MKIESMLFRAEANRLFSCRLMDAETFRKELQAALEDAYNRGMALVKENTKIAEKSHRKLALN